MPYGSQTGLGGPSLIEWIMSLLSQADTSSPQQGMLVPPLARSHGDVTYVGPEHSSPEEIRPWSSGAEATKFRGGGTYNQGALTDAWRNLPSERGSAPSRAGSLLSQAETAAVGVLQGNRGANDRAKALAELLGGGAQLEQNQRLSSESPVKLAETAATTAVIRKKLADAEEEDAYHARGELTPEESVGVLKTWIGEAARKGQYGQAGVSYEDALAQYKRTRGTLPGLQDQPPGRNEPSVAPIGTELPKGVASAPRPTHPVPGPGNKVFYGYVEGEPGYGIGGGHEVTQHGVTYWIP